VLLLLLFWRLPGKAAIVLQPVDRTKGRVHPKVVNLTHPVRFSRIKRGRRIPLSLGYTL